ncbi:hypothetical protein [Umezawaea sp.]|uniref:hypothetical protein n=1 Tax=Umezawaea sp. TaxID=1955258 RepID=UPI002ED1CD43
MTETPAAGTTLTSGDGLMEVGGRPVPAPPRPSPDRTLPAVGTTTGLLGAAMATGRCRDEGHLAGRDRVAVLGGGAAELLGVHRTAAGPLEALGGVDAQQRQTEHEHP